MGFYKVFLVKGYKYCWSSCRSFWKTNSVKALKRVAERTT